MSENEEYRILVTKGKETLFSMQVIPSQFAIIIRALKTFFSKKDLVALKKSLDK